MPLPPDPIAPIPIPPDINNLPIIPELPHITHTVRQNKATVLIGATGSGKTTQVGLHLLRQGLALDKRIGVTQPRRLATTSVAKFVSELYGCELGEEVGYQIRFDDTTMEGTKLKFMTDGILLQEASVDPLFNKYSVLIFDEAHEQGLNTDIGLGLAKRALAQRNDLKVVIMSATIDTGRFSEYFDNAPVIIVEGRTFPIKTRYLDPTDHQAAVHLLHEESEAASLPALAALKVHQIHTSKLEEAKDPKTQESTTTESELKTPNSQEVMAKASDESATKRPINELTNNESLSAGQLTDATDEPDTRYPKPETRSRGHILIFMPGKKEIAQTIEYIEQLGFPDLLPLPAHSEMDQAEQQRVFEHTDKRKVVVATNIAETSITVPDLEYVIDSGLIRQMMFNHKYGIGALLTIEHSKAGLRQRQGRAGRTRPGTYLPLFTRREYDTGRPEFLQPGQSKRPEYSIPEIQREDLSGAVLRMSRLHITDLEEFDFMNAPSKGAIHDAILALKVLGALDNNGTITPLGEQMATLPVEPRISRMILAAEEFGCLKEIVTIAASLSTGNIFVRPIGEETAADEAKTKLEDRHGDLFTLLKIVPLYQKQKPDKREAWALQHYLNHHTLHEILQIEDQLKNLLSWLEIPITSLQDDDSGYGLRATGYDKKIKKSKRGQARYLPDEPANSRPQTPLANRQSPITAGTKYQLLGQAITAGLLQNLAVKKGEYEYIRANGTTMRIHPGSVWADRRPGIIVFTEILEINGSTYAVNCQAVELEWIQQLAPHLITTRQQPLNHPWKDVQVGTYTITELNGQEIGRRYSGKKLPQHLMAEGFKESNPKPKRKGRHKHDQRHKNKGKRRRHDKPGQSWTN